MLDCKLIVTVRQLNDLNAQWDCAVGRLEINFKSRTIAFHISAKLRSLVTLFTYGHMARCLLSSRLISIHSIQARLTHYFDEYTTGLVSHEKVKPEGEFQSQKWCIFKNQFLFHELNYFIKACGIQKLLSIHFGKYDKP